MSFYFCICKIKKKFKRFKNCMCHIRSDSNGHVFNRLIIP